MLKEIKSLVTSRHRQLRSIALSYADFEECDDLLQEICLQLWRSRNSFRGDAKIETWMYRVAINTSITYQRKKIKQRKLQTTVAEPLQQRSEPSGMGQEQMLVAFANDLGKVDRAIFVMYIDGLDTHQMESVLAMSGNAIKVRISRMKKKFRKQFVV